MPLTDTALKALKPRNASYIVIALTCGLIQANPVMALPMRHVYRAAARDRALTPDEIRQFLRALQTSNLRHQFKIAFQLILMTLVRKSELMLAQWKDVHLDDGEWHIPVENFKTGNHISSTCPLRRIRCSRNSSRWPVAVSGCCRDVAPGQALRQQCAESGAVGIIAGAGDPSFHHP